MGSGDEGKMTRDNLSKNDAFQQSDKNESDRLDSEEDKQSEPEDEPEDSTAKKESEGIESDHDAENEDNTHQEKDRSEQQNSEEEDNQHPKVESASETNSADEANQPKTRGNLIAINDQDENQDIAEQTEERYAFDKESAAEEDDQENRVAEQKQSQSGPRKLREELKTIMDANDPDVNRVCSILDAMIEMQATITIPDIVLGSHESLGMIVRRLRKHDNEELKKVAGILYEDFLTRVKAEKDFLDAQKRETDDKARMKKDKQKQAKQRRKNLDSLADQQKMRGQERERIRADRETGKESKEEKRKKRKRATDDDDVGSKKTKKREKVKEDRKGKKGKKKHRRSKASASQSPESSAPDEDEGQEEKQAQEEAPDQGRREWSEEAVREEVWRILARADLATITHRNVRERLANIFLPEQVEEYKGLVKDVTSAHIKELGSRRVEWSEGALRAEVERIVSGGGELTKRMVRERLQAVFGEEAVEGHRDLVKRTIADCTSALA